MSGRDKYFTQEEAEFVRRNYTRFTNKQIASRIRRTVESVRQFKYRNGLSSKEMADKSRRQTIKRRENLLLSRLKRQESVERLLNSTESVDKEENLLMEMKALINLCEITDNKAIRERAKIKLMQLSDIPKDNPYALKTVKC